MERRSHKERQRFLDIALGSCGELRTLIYIGIEIGYIKKGVGTVWVNETREISAMLIGLHNSLPDH